MLLGLYHGLHPNWRSTKNQKAAGDNISQWLKILMEAVGIEPTSEDTVTGTSTSLACLFDLVPPTSNKQDVGGTSRCSLTSLASARKRGQPVYDDALIQPNRQGR